MDQEELGQRAGRASGLGKGSHERLELFQGLKGRCGLKANVALRIAPSAAILCDFLI